MEGIYEEYCYDPEPCSCDCDGRLETIAERAFDGLTSLKVLSVNAHKIKSLPSKLFQGLTSLRRISFQYNLISSLAIETFRGLGNLEYLD